MPKKNINVLRTVCFKISFSDLIPTNRDTIFVQINYTTYPHMSKTLRFLGFLDRGVLVKNNNRSEKQMSGVSLV